MLVGYVHNGIVDATTTRRGKVKHFTHISLITKGIEGQWLLSVVYEVDGFAIMGGGGNRRCGAIGAMADVFAVSDPNQPLEKATCVIVVKP